MKAARLLAVVLLVTAAFVLGFDTGGRQAPDPVPPSMPPSGRELWDSLPVELLANVAEGIQEQISDLQDDLARVQVIQREKISRDTTG